MLNYSKISKVPKYNFSAVLLLVAFIILMFTTALAGYVGRYEFEDKFLVFVYNWPTWLNSFFVILTYGGSIFAAAGLSIWLSLRRSLIVIFFVVSTVVTYFLVEAMKQAIARPRPFETLAPEIVARDLQAYGFGFPSGHVAISVVIAYTLHRLYPKVSWAFWVGFVTFVGLSRIYLGVHDLLDILGGASLALVICVAAEILIVKSNKLRY
ncbi:MAG: phosphatase PAP2 family protein [Patescibacteria group bacterium]